MDEQLAVLVDSSGIGVFSDAIALQSKCKRQVGELTSATNSAPSAAVVRKLVSTGPAAR